MALRRSIIVAPIAVALAAAALWFGFGRAPAAPAVAVQSAPLVRTLQFSGRVATRSRVEVGSTVTGRVATVLVREGQTVIVGQPLVQLEDAEWRAALAQAEAGARQATARLAGLQDTGLDAAAAGVAQADAQVHAAEADVRRTRDLVAKGFLSAARLDEVERAAAVARAQRDGADAQRRGLDRSGSEIVQARAQQTLSRAAVDAARERLAQATVRAPSAARVLSREVEPGQIVQPGRALLMLALDGPVELAAQVDERFLEELRLGQSASVRADAFPAARFTARLQRIAPRVDAQRGSIELRFELPTVPAFLREDMTLSLEVTTAERERTRVLPLAALRGGAAGADDDRDQVWVVHEGRVQPRPVRVGLRTLQAVEVLDGLSDGEQVLVGPAPAPGQRVRTIAYDPAAAPAGSGSEAGAAISNAMGR
ncbi:MAG: efflux RND transporter periplasmic adaptor subunit [Rubrivivax sp.]